LTVTRPSAHGQQSFTTFDRETSSYEAEQQRPGPRPKLIWRLPTSVQDLFSYHRNFCLTFTATVGTNTTCPSSGLFGDSSFSSEVGTASQYCSKQLTTRQVSTDLVDNSAQKPDSTGAKISPPPASLTLPGNERCARSNGAEENNRPLLLLPAQLC
jgi:hypothetical protein